MYVDPTRPLPIPGEKKDYLGSVLNALLQLHYTRIENVGDDVQFKQKVTQATTNANQALDKFALDIDNALKAHTNARGKLHGETKETVGLSNKDNWRFATEQEHIDKANNLYANPAGLKMMVERILTIDPKKYIRSRILPVASSGHLGSIPQSPWSWEEGEVVQSPADPMNYYGNTPWQFRTDNGVMIYPAMNGSDVLTQAVANPGRAKRASLPWGGTMARLYNRNLDLRRTRPSYLRAESNTEPKAELLKASRHLFDRHSAYCAEPNGVSVRTFNRYRLPFDTLTNNSQWTNNWSGILESRENFLYNLVSNIVYDNVGGFGQDLYLTLELYPYTFTQDGLDVKNGPGRAAETTAVIQDIYTTLTYTVPASGKVRIWNRTGKPAGLCVKLRDILNYTDTQLADLVNSVDYGQAKLITFAWINRLKGNFAIRVPVSFYSKDKNYYTNYYLDLSFTVSENVTSKSANVNVAELRDMSTSIQTLDDNLQVSAAGRFIQSPVSVKDDVFHPLVFNGSFDSLGGHVKTYTFYNRQYVGYYQHGVDGALTWINNGDNVRPTLTKYQYAQMSTLNQDGLYGDHLRHIPLAVKDGKIDYLTYSRDWRHNYRWAVANIQADTAPEMLTSTGHHYGPWRNDVTWIEPKDNKVPSFVIANNESSPGFDNTCLVFNTQNGFTGYGRYGYDVTNQDEPLVWLDPVSVDQDVLAWIAQNGGGWIKSHKQMFYYQGILYWFSQTLDPAEMLTDGTDCYYGVIKNVFIDVQNSTRTLKVNGDVQSNATVTPLKVNSKASLSVDSRNVTGWDAFNDTDVYIMLMERTGTISRYQVMVNLGPFNNFYLEFESVVDTETGSVTFRPNTKAVDPVFPYNTGIGFAIDYNKVTGYGTKTPHQFHINFQSPVMLKKSMWSLRKTPGNYGLFSQSIGTVIAQGGIMNTVRGTPIFPVGSVVTAGGSNIIVKAPVTAQNELFGGNDELFAKASGSSENDGAGTINVSLYGRKYNPNVLETEPSSGVIPCGFLKNGFYYHYDPDGWRTDLLPVVDGKRMNFYGYGSSFPAFLGVNGSGIPINRFFLSDKPTAMSWNTLQGRDIPVGSGTNLKISVNGAAQAYNGSGTFTIPVNFTGTVDILITGMINLKWAPGLTTLTQIGNTVMSLDFSNSAGFTINAPLPKRIKSLKGLFKNATGATYPNIELWSTENVTDMSELCMGAVNFNHDITNWNLSNVTTLENAFAGATKFNQAIGKWNTGKVRTMKNMFLNATTFNQDISTWETILVADFSYMFKGATSFNANIGNWHTTSGSDFTSMFEGATAFNIDISRWDMAGTQRTTAMFKGATAFNSPLNSWNMSSVVYMDEMFSGATVFNRNLGSWDTSHATTMREMFLNTPAFGAANESDLSGWNTSNVVDMTRMFKQSGFNSPIANWRFGQDAVLVEMFANTPNFNQDISSWDVRNVSSMANMFLNNTVFVKDIKNWNLGNCGNFNYMFANSNYNGDLSGWTLSTTKEITMVGMFNNCPFFTGKGLSTWNTGKVTTFTGMFQGATVFNADVSGWNVGSGTVFRNMFRQTNNFNRDLTTWDMSNATDTSDMFRDAKAFNGDLSTWNTGKVALMNGMFASATLFNQDIGNWDTGKVTNFAMMFQETPFNKDIGRWNTANATNMASMFMKATQFNQDLSGWSVGKVTDHTNFDTDTPAWVLAKPIFAA